MKNISFDEFAALPELTLYVELDANDFPIDNQILMKQGTIYKGLN